MNPLSNRIKSNLLRTLQILRCLTFTSAHLHPYTVALTFEEQETESLTINPTNSFDAGILEPS